MSPIAHDVAAVLLVIGGAIVLMGMTPADERIGWALLAAAGLPLLTGFQSRRRRRADRSGHQEKLGK